jgi:hypothetical protein
MKYFNNYIIYELPPKILENESQERIHEFVVKQQTHCEKTRDGKYIIILGHNSTEENIIENLNHEYLHASLHLLDESLASKKLDQLWYRYKFKESIVFRKILEEMSYSGIGYPYRASILERLKAFVIIARTSIIY